MATTHRYQVMPDLSPEEYAALKADIAINGVRIPIEVDEEGNIIDGFNRKQICDELGIECPTRGFFGHTEEEKLEHAWRLNLMRRHLTPEQKHETACTLREAGWTQDRIAQLVGVSQSTIGNWLNEFTNSGKLRQPNTVQGIDGNHYPSKKRRRRAEQPIEQANVPETPQIPSDTGDRSAPALEQQERPQSRYTHAEAQSPGTELSVASDVPDAQKTSSLDSDAWQTAPGGQVNSPSGSSPVPAAEDDDDAHWVGALQDLSARLETLQARGGPAPQSKRLAPATRTWCVAKIRRMQEILGEWEEVVGADMYEVADGNGHGDGDVTPSPAPPPVADTAQEYGNRELVAVSSAEDRVGDAADGDQFPSQGGGEGFLG